MKISLILAFIALASFLAGAFLENDKLIKAAQGVAFLNVLVLYLYFAIPFLK